MAESIADEFDALVLHGDATDPALLEKAQVCYALALLALTGSDPINRSSPCSATASSSASSSDCGPTPYVAPWRRYVTDIVAPTMAAAARVEAALHGAAQAPLSEIIQGRLQIGEFTAGPHVSGGALGHLRMPDAAMVIAIVTGAEASLSRPDDSLEEGQVVV